MTNVVGDIEGTSFVEDLFDSFDDAYLQITEFLSLALALEELEGVVVELKDVVIDLLSALVVVDNDGFVDGGICLSGTLNDVELASAAFAKRVGCI